MPSLQDGDVHRSSQLCQTKGTFHRGVSRDTLYSLIFEPKFHPSDASATLAEEFRCQTEQLWWWPPKPLYRGSTASCWWSTSCSELSFFPHYISTVQKMIPPPSPQTMANASLHVKQNKKAPLLCSFLLCPIVLLCFGLSVLYRMVHKQMRIRQDDYVSVSHQRR